MMTSSVMLSTESMNERYGYSGHLAEAIVAWSNTVNYVI
jgi:hypothetical protein